MLHFLRPLVCFAVLCAVGCGTLGQYNDTPTLTIVGPLQSPVEAIQSVFLAPPTPYRISFAEADPGNGEAIEDEDGMSALGVGGLFLPLVFDLTAFDIDDVQPTDDGVSFSATLESEVNLIPTWQGRVRGRVRVDDQGVARLTLSPFYANWVIIGNVIAGAKLSFENLDAPAESFTGYYSISFFGTGNALGSGYYRAGLGPIPAADGTDQAHANNP